MSTGGTSLSRALHNEAHQLSLLGVDASPDDIDALRGPDGRLPADAFRQLRRQGAKKQGRPLGSVNKRSEQLAKLVIHEFGDPVLGGASLYAMPLDQLCEMLLVADGTQERQAQLQELTAELAGQVAELSMAIGLAARNGDVAELTKAADRIADAAESLETVAKGSGKAGALALQALNVQLTARRFVAEYVHSKRPTAVDVTVKRDGVLVMPGGAAAGASEDAAFVAEQLGNGMRSGKLDVDQAMRLEFRNGQLHDPDGEIEDADFAAVDDGDDDMPGGDA